MDKNNRTEVKMTNQPNLFLVTTPGLSATRWLSFALAARPDVFVSHGRHPFDSVINGDLHREKGIGDIESVTVGVQYAELYQRMPLAKLFETWAGIMPGAAAYGNVHAFTLNSLAQKIQSQGSINNLRVVNVLRHPINYIESHCGLVKTAEANNRELFQGYENMLRRAIDMFPEIRTMKGMPRLDLTAFVVSCLSVANRAVEFGFQGIQHYRMEELTTRLEVLADYCLQATGLPYPEDKLGNMIGLGAINTHRKSKGPKSPAGIFAGWPDWKRELIKRIIPDGMIKHLSDHGYDMSMFEGATNFDSVPAPETVASPPAAETGMDLNKADRDAPSPLAEGNYIAAALGEGAKDWETRAALGLIGKTEEIETGAESQDDNLQHFYLGVALWMDGRENEAATILDGIDSDHARRLVNLIRQDKIRILAQVPPKWKESPERWASIQSTDKFIVRNIGFHQGDLPNEPGLDILKYLDAANPPDIFFCAALEDHLIPQNLNALPCPIFGYTANPEAHIQALYPWLGVFDEIIVGDHYKWEATKRLTGKPVSSYPLDAATNTDAPTTSAPQKDIDLLICGVIDGQKIPDFPEGKNIVFLDPSMKADAIRDLLTRTKVVYLQPGARPDIVLDAIDAGCRVVSEKGSPAGLFAGEPDGYYQFDPKAGTTAELPENMLNRLIESADGSPHSPKPIRPSVSPSKTADRFLRFLTFLAAKPSPERERSGTMDITQKRFLLKPGPVAGEPRLWHVLARHGISRLEARIKTRPEIRDYIDITREMVLDYGGALAYIRDVAPNMEPPHPQYLDIILNTLSEGVNRFQQCLTLRFNLIRTALHYGTPGHVTTALAFARQTLEMHPSHWKTDVLEDVLPGDFFPEFFNHAKYSNLARHSLATGFPVGEAHIRLILASIHYYLSFYANHIEHASKAVSLDRDFPFYKLRMAKLLIERAGIVNRDRADGVLTHVALNTGATKDDVKMAEALLLDLLKNPKVFAVAHRVLASLADSGTLSETIPETDAARMRLYENALKTSADLGIKQFIHAEPTLQPAGSLEKIEYVHKLAAHKASESRTYNAAAGTAAVQ